PDFTRVMEGFAGNDFFRGDLRDGYSEMVRYIGSPNGVNVNLGLNFAQDGYDSNSTLAGVQSFNDTLIGIDFIQGSMFNDTLVGGGLSHTYNGSPFENFEGMK